MDCDDNDFQRQIVCLGGEGTKYPSASQTYVPPRFDFEDSLQGHLRFDSLVDSDIFLGIGSNEDNQWIENFSRGTSAVGFNSAGADTSILRRNNVWSEATSSESVEMLLKSVRREENNRMQSSIANSVSLCELGSVAGQMETSSKIGSDIFSKTGDSTESHPLLTSLDIPNSSVMKEDIRVDDIQIHCSSPCCETSLDSHAIALNIDAASDKERGSTVMEGNIPAAEQLTGKDEGKMNMLDDKFGNNCPEEFSASVLQVNNNIQCNSEMGSQDVSHQSDGISENKAENTEGSSKNVIQHHKSNDKDPVESNDQNVDWNRDECDVTNLENPRSDPTVVSENVETIMFTVNPSSVTGKDDSLIQIPDESRNSVCSSAHNKDGECFALSVDAQMSANDMHQVSLLPEAHTNPDRRVEEDGNNKTAGSTSPTLSMDSPVQMRCSVQEEYTINSSKKSNTDGLVYEPEICLLGARKNLDSSSGEVGSSDSHKEGISSLVVEHSSAKPLMKPPAFGISNVVSRICIDVKEPSAPVVSPLACEFEPKSDQSTLSSQADTVESGKSRAMTVEEGSELSVDMKNDIKSSEVKDDVEKGALELIPQLTGSDETVRITHTGKAMSTVELSSGASLSSPALSSVVCEADSLSERVNSVTVDAGFKKIHSNVMATGTNHGSIRKMEVSPAMSNLGVREGNLAEVPNSPGRLEDPNGQVNNKEVSQLTGDISRNLEGPPGPGLCGIDAKLKLLNDENHHAETNYAVCDSPTVFKPIAFPPLVDRTEECRVAGDNSAEVAKEIDKYYSKALLIPQSSSGNRTTKDGKGSTYKQNSVSSVTETETAKSTEVASMVSASIALQMVGETSKTCLRQSDIKTSHDISGGNLQQPAGEVLCIASKDMSGRKSRRSSSTASSKGSAKNRKILNEASPIRQSGKGKKSVNTSFSPSGICSSVYSTGLHLFGNAECNSGKTLGVLASSTPCVRDLSTSAFSSSPPQYQHFTDLQQVQLRAQILVYGALIQGTVPDETCMVSAFGGSDGGRNIWGNARHTALEKLQSQKVHTRISETPLQSHFDLSSTVSRVDHLNSSSASWNKVNTTPVARAGSGGIPSSVASPMIPLSSPLWNYPTPSLHSYQVPPTRSLLGHNTSWVSQASFLNPWVASPQASVPDSSSHIPTYPSEMVQLTHVKESSVPQYSAAKHASATPMIRSGSPGDLLMSTFPTVNTNKTSTLTVQQPGSRSKKRRKASISEDLDRIIIQPESNTEIISVPAGDCHPSVSLGMGARLGFDSKVSPEASSVNHTIELLDYGKQRANLSVETLGKIKEARIQADYAAATATAATNHCQELWRELAKQSTSRLAPDIEDRLSSAAAAIAAAACVAKAAAAAAIVASNAALQAKLMGEEALVSGGYIKDLSDDMNNVSSTSASILKGGYGAQTTKSPIGVAKEAAKRRIEAATAASKQAENVDAIVKAAELAEEAVSHAGRIVAMGDHLTMAELVRSGPEGYWKSHMPPVLACNISEGRIEHDDKGRSEEVPDTSKHHHNQGAYVNEENMPCSAAAIKDDGGQKGSKAFSVARTVGVVPESETAIQIYHYFDVQTMMQTTIAEGSHVEVLGEGGGLTAWHQGKVLDIQDGKAFICYTELKSDKGSGNIKEWVALNKENEAPRIRIARPMVATQFEGRKKRRRDAMENYNWSAGDHVDAWVQDKWCEGIVTEKSKKDNAAFTVQFHEQTSDVKAWHLRPSLVWMDGKWIECSQSRSKHGSPHESDSPLVKRQRMGTPADENEKDKKQENSNSEESGNTEDVRLLDLAANEKLFRMGKSKREEKKHESSRSFQTKLQKGGSRVIFGVPKPGKKRKFMEVSKHYISDQGSKSKGNESTKFAKYLMPQGLGSQGSKVAAKSNLKDIRGAVTKPKIPKSGNSHVASARYIIQKDKDIDTSVSAPGEVILADHNDSKKESTFHDPNALVKNGPDGSAVEGSFVFSSVAVQSDVPSRRTDLSNKGGRANKGKRAPVGAKLAKSEEVSHRSESNTSSQAGEPRRSNRRIQPTSRLLEGLQSAFIPKIPSLPHYGSHRSQNRSVPRGSSRS